ncbi:MAG: DUF1080 domain-containing protein [Flavobacteriaceae bacterium]|jgi:hypothetical protein
MRFLRLKNIFLGGTLCLLLVSCKTSNSSAHIENWESLFNGQNLDGWTIKIANRPLNENYLNTFQVEDQMLRIVYDQYEDFDDKYGHLYYKQPYSHYKLRFDYRFVGAQTPGGEDWNVRNSGVMFHSQSAASNAFEQHFPVSVEIQLLGGLGEGNRTTANICTPGTAVVLQDSVDYSHCISSQSKTYHGDQWVRVEAVVLGSDYVAHIVEQDTVLEYKSPQVGGAFISKNQNGADWERMGVTNKEYWIAKEGALLSEGYIALQAESHPIDFKNIELLNLCGCTDPKALNYKSYYVKNDPASCQYK